MCGAKYEETPSGRQVVLTTIRQKTCEYYSYLIQGVYPIPGKGHKMALYLGDTGGGV